MLEFWNENRLNFYDPQAGAGSVRYLITSLAKFAYKFWNFKHGDPSSPEDRLPSPKEIDDFAIDLEREKLEFESVEQLDTMLREMMDPSIRDRNRRRTLRPSHKLIIWITGLDVLPKARS